MYLIGRRSICTRGGRGGMSCQEQRVTTASTASRTRSSTTQQEQQQERASSSEGEESGEEEEDDEPVAGPSGGTKGRGRTSTKKSKLYKANKSKLN